MVKINPIITIIGIGLAGIGAYFGYKYFQTKKQVSPSGPVVIPSPGSFTLEWTNVPVAVPLQNRVVADVTIDNEKPTEFVGVLLAGIEDINGNDIGPIIVRNVDALPGKMVFEGLAWNITPQIATLSQVVVHATVYKDSSLTQKVTDTIVWHVVIG